MKLSVSSRFRGVEYTHATLTITAFSPSDGDLHLARQLAVWDRNHEAWGQSDVYLDAKAHVAALDREWF